MLRPLHISPSTNELYKTIIIAWLIAGTLDISEDKITIVLFIYCSKIILFKVKNSYD